MTSLADAERIRRLEARVAELEARKDHDPLAERVVKLEQQFLSLTGRVSAFVGHNQRRAADAA